MSALFLLFPILLPIAGGLAIIPLGFTDDAKRNRYAESVVVLTSVLAFACIALCGRDSAELYRFTAGFSIAFRIDFLSCLFGGMVALMWPLVMVYAFDYMKHAARKNKFFAFYVMTYGVTLGVAFSGNMTTLYVFYEMLSLVTIPLVSHYEDHESMYAGRKYAAYTIGGASLAFFAVVMTTVFGDGGTFVYGGSLSGAGSIAMLRLSFLFGFFGFGVKAAVFPLHDWLPTASVAPTPVTALLHAVAVVNSGVFAITRMTWYAFGPDILKGTGEQAVSLAVSCFTLVYTAALAVKERRFKRRLALSTVSNLSYMLFGILLLTPAGLSAGLAHMVFHSVTKMLLFLCAGAFMHVTGNTYIYELNGVGRRMPVTFALYTVGALSLTGIPLFCCFVSKWMLLEAGLKAGTKWGMLGVVSLIVSAFLCAVYTLTVTARAFFPREDKDFFRGRTSIGEAEKGILLPIIVFAAAVVLFGMFPMPLVNFLNAVAAGLG
ncbi:MAG: proton-conducting membrane transporter [Lachnospiraceae bacterium]|nr:proton-conducting membrane transporter [Lachnospiraceae bacterium]